MEKYRFGDFELDLDAFELRRRGAVVRLERRPLDLLALLVKQSQRMVSREEIVAALWPPNVVIDFDTGLNTLVRKVRNALGDSSEAPAFIETVPGRGYRFIAPVAPVTSPAAEAPQPAPIASAGARPVRGRKTFLLATSAALVVAIAVAVFVWRAGVDAPPETTRIAVMPFENLTGDDKLAYLAAGLAEETTTTLAQIDPDRLRVIGLTATPTVDQSLPIDAVGRELGVDFLVVGSLRLDRTRMRVTSRLLRVADGEQVWSATLDRELTNILGLQRELSTAIAEQIRLRLSPEVAAALSRRQTQDPAAYSLYLQGRYEWSQLTPASTRRALEYFQQATKADPNYALAWAGLAFATVSAMRTVDMEPSVMKPIALAALRRAQQLGPDLAETQYAAGYYDLFGDLNARAAEQAARRAIELDPNNAQARLLLGAALTQLGQYVEAGTEIRRARELEPTFALTFANSALVALAAGAPNEALEFAKQAVAINPEFWVGYFYLGRARGALGDPQGALQGYAEADRYSGGHSLVDEARATVLMQLGRREEVQALLAAMTARAADRYVPAYSFAVVHALLGNVDAAFDSLDRAVEARDLGLANLERDPRLQALHGDPRFQAILRRCGCGAESPVSRPPG